MKKEQQVRLIIRCTLWPVTYSIWCSEIRKNPVKTRENHVSCRVLQSYNPPGDWASELFKSSTDSASLVVKVETKFFCFQWRVFEGERHKWECFWLHLLGPGPQPAGPLLWLKIFSETRPNPCLYRPWM